MVSNEEIKKMLEDRRRGVKPETKIEAPTPVPPVRKKVPDDTQICESCGTENPKDAKFCIGCGNNLEQVVEASQEPAEDKPLPRSEAADYKKCPNCQHHNQPQAKFCVVCGQKMEDVTGEGSTPKEEITAVEEEVSEELTVEEPLPEETPPTATPEVKTFKLGQSSLEKEEKEVITPTPPEEVEETPVVETPVEPPVETPRDTPKTEATPDVDPMEKIKKAKELLDLGAITSEEFEEIKKKYVELI
ncbi:MAG: zinc ribbon domain-containing protein [Methanobacteriaceae archaeon]|nr:zinc ribbon domain-containing protein [Methanobacteriaceae archaeon]